MYVVTVTPLGRGIGKESLSYFYSEWVAAGSILSVPLRSKKVWALVTECDKVESHKAALKSAKYALKPIAKQKPRRLFLPEGVRAATTMARLHASTTGAVLFNLAPMPLLEESPEYPKTKEKDKSGIAAPEPHVVHATMFDRPLLFRRLVRETLATGSSCYVIAPTITRARELYAVLSRGIEEQSHILHGSLTTKKAQETWNAAIESKNAILLIATPHYLTLPRTDLATIILEAESDASYIARSRPFVDIRTFAIEYAKELHATIHLADNFFRTETYYHSLKNEYQASFPFSFRTCSEIGEELIDMNSETMLALSHGQAPRTITIPLLSTRLVGKLSANITSERSTLLFVSRKGLAPQTICGDCGTPITCPTCKLPAMLHETKKQTRIYACHYCQEVLPSETTCPTCHGWRLVALGIGTEGVKEELHRLFPHTPVVLIDSTNTPTAAAAKKAYKLFSSKPGSILVGTEMALRVLQEPLESAAVVSIDNRFSIPDYRVHEQTYRTLVTLRECSRDPVIIQTRHPKHPLFNLFQSKPYAQFYEHELDERKTFGYPPFVTLIRLTITESPDRIDSTVDEILKELREYEVVSYEALRPLQKGKNTTYILIKIPTDAWQRVAHDTADEYDQPYSKLLTYLRSLSPAIVIEHDPARII